MAEEDIYGSKKKYLRRIKDLDELTEPVHGDRRIGRRRYYCKNPENLKHFTTLHHRFEAQDLSYVRRNRYLDTLLFLVHHTTKSLSDCTRADVDALVAAGHRTNKSVHSKTCFLKALKRIWRVLFPELDEKGRPDERMIPYAVRHLSSSVDRSQQKLRQDRLSLEEYEQIVGFFAADAEMQAYITLAVESLGRPQEICYTRVKDVELHENYACVWVSEHGKEGTKFLQSVDSYPYLLDWFRKHPFQKEPEAFLFLTGGLMSRSMTPANINKKLRIACKRLGIQKRITAYSLKRNGVTFSRLRGDSDVEIQHRAGWTSTRQITTYDLSTAKDAFKTRLAKLGLREHDEGEVPRLSSKLCACGKRIGFAARICGHCKRSTEGKKGQDEGSQALSEIKRFFAVASENPELTFAEILKASGMSAAESG